MDIATRFQPRVRPQAEYLEAERNGMPHDGDEGLSHPRRKIPRTATDSDAAATTHTFRKPTLPASAMRPAAGLEHRSSLSQRQRKGTLRENVNVRVPSGPREFPGSPGKRMGSSGSNLMMVAPTATANEASPAPTSRAFPSKDTANTEPFQLNARLPPTATAEPSRFSFGATGNQHSSTSDADSPTTPAERATDGFDFVPTMNFDDFQNSIVDPDWTSPMLGEFPGVSGGRALPRVPKERESGGGSGQVVKGTGNGNGNGFVSTRPAQLLKLERGTAQEDRGAVGRTPSFSRRRISVAPTGTSRNAAGQSGTATAGIPTSASQPNLSLRTRRQSTVPPNSQPSNSQTSTTTLTQQTPPSAGTGGSRAPHKSLGPGLITSMMDRKASTQQATPSTPGDGLKPALSHSSSLSRARRTTMQPSASAGAELPRLSTLAANNANTKSQSRANRVRSMMQPPPPNSYRGLPDTPDTAGHSRAVSKGAFTSKDQTHTPSSSASKRQSTAANMGGRASGLGARTISPTDARRLKRMSMMPAPPMPTTLPKEAPPAPPTHTPRLTQPSPSLIPVKAQSATPTVGHAHSAGEGRAASPVDIRRELPALPGLPLGTGVMSGSLSSKSSYQSLASNTGSNGNGSGHGSGSGSNSRLPTPKAKQRSSSTGSLQWNSGEGREGYGEAYAGRGDLVPPVPAIPKVYESPKEPLTDPGSFPFFAETPRTSVDVPRSGGAATTIPKTGAQPARAEDATGGRRNNNLQPLRLPPMNLQPTLPRPSQELESRENYAQITAQTPEPRRMAKTPSTPMTASKATLFQRRQHEDQAFPAIRSSTSHYALRDVMGQQFDVEGALPGGGVRIPANLVGSGDVSGTGYGNVRQQQRSAITPFASGSLPKGEAEIARLRAGMPSGEGYQDDYDLGAYADGLQLQQARPMQGVTTRPKTSGNDSLPVEKKEGGLRRKLSLGWRRSSSKNGNALLAVDPAKGSPLLHGLPQETFEKEVMEKEKERLGPNRLRKRSAEMPPPATLPQGRPSLEAAARRKSTIAGTLLNGSVTSQQQQQAAPHGAPAGNVGNSEQQLMTITGSGAAKTRALHSEQPQPVPPPPAAATRASSWGHFGSRTAVLGKPAATTTSTAAAPKHKFTASTLSAIVKDKDDLAADDEMRRLSQKRRDVDAAAKESEALKLRAVARTPVSPERVLVDRHVGLNIFERGEIVDYGQDGIYFTGTKNAKKIIGSLSGGGDSSAEKDAQAGNYGYDDERGDYNIVMGDHLAYRYEVVDLLGKGSFGQVVRCVDHKEGGVVAVKIIRNKKRFHQQALVEVGILGKLREWDPDEANATLSITSSFYFRSHLCIVTPCLSINLYEFIRAHNFAGFSLPLIRRFARQLLACLVLLQKKKIIHCDLKPENILLCEARKADVRVIDFGSSCREEEKVYTYIQSRFYRSPEVILGSSYGMGIDMWSLGCILAELWTGYPLFPGENEQEQLACIMEIFGPPDRQLVERCTRKKLFFDSVGKPRVTVSSKGRRRRPSSKTLQQALKTEDEAFVDFVARCLRWDPERRMKPAEAVSHPFIANVPFHQRAQGIPDEARVRGAKVRAPASPVKVPSSRIAASAQQQQPNYLAPAVASTPAKEKIARALPETPQTALRHGAATQHPNARVGSQGSPSKLTAAAMANRRHSAILVPGGSAKRASNGAALSGVAPGSNLAAMAAREVMHGAGQQTQSAQAASRWRGA